MTNLNKTRLKAALATLIATCILTGSLLDEKFFILLALIGCSIAIVACFYNMFFICFENDKTYK